MSQPLMIRLLSASVAAANRAGEIIREVLSSGKLGLVQKVRLAVGPPSLDPRPNPSSRVGFGVQTKVQLLVWWHTCSYVGLASPN